MKHRFPTKTQYFMPSNELFMNPHKGFTTFQRFRGDKLNENWSVETGWKMEHIPPQDDLYRGMEINGYPDTSLCYFRIPWRRLEPKQGEYDFSFIDFVLNRATERGQKVIFRFPPNAARPGELELPQWLVDELGLPEREIGYKNSPDHPLFYNSYSNFIREVGKYIDGDPRVSAIDMSLVSAWGEGHQIDMVSDENWMMLVDAYMQSIEKTPISAQFNHVRSVRYANEYRPVGLRMDCLGNMNHHMINHYPRALLQMGDLWKKAPIAFEVCWIMRHWLEMGWDIDYIIEQSLKWHITSFNEKSARIPDELMGKVNEWIKKMGYRFSVRYVDYPAEACAGDRMYFSMWIENRGAAPIYHRYPFILRLRSEHNTYDFETDADITSWMPGDNEWVGSIVLPEYIVPGDYVLEAGIGDGDTKIRIATDSPVHDGFNLIADRIIIK